MEAHSIANDCMTEAITIEQKEINYHTSPSQAQAAATEFLLDHVGNQLIAGRPHLMVSTDGAVWVIPIQLTYIHTGALGIVGVVAIDDETGQVTASTPLTQIKSESRKLREQYEPVVSQRFLTFLNKPRSETRSIPLLGNRR
jgi:hypothetical protein